MRRLAAFVMGVVLLSSGAALAQDRGDISAGYRLLHVSSDGDSENLNKGWYFDVAGHLTDVFSIVGDVGGSYRTVTESEGLLTAKVDFKVHTFAGGVRARASTANPNVVPFGQVLFGGATAKVKATAGTVTLFDDSSTDPLLNIGGGVDVTPGGSVGVRLMAGYVRVFGTDGANVFTFSVGAKFGF
jgi:hypothetical protein